MSNPEIEQQTHQAEPQGILLTGEGALALDEQQRELLRQVASQMAGGLSVEATLAYDSSLVGEPEPQSHLLTEEDFRANYMHLPPDYKHSDVWFRVYRTFSEGMDRSTYAEAPLVFLPKGNSLALDIRSAQRRLIVSGYAADAWHGKNSKTVPFLRLLTDMHLPPAEEPDLQA